MTIKGLVSAALVGLSLAASVAHAQTALPGAPPAGISVTGHAELKVKPDIASVSFSVVTQARRRVDAVRANAGRMQHVLAVLAKSGIASRDIETQSFTVESENGDTRRPSLVTGYQVTNTLLVTIHDLSNAGSVVDDTVQAGANAVDSLSYDLADRENAQNEAFDAAIAAAHRRAERFAQDAGVTLGPVISISDSVSPYDKPRREGDGEEFLAVRSAPATRFVTQLIAFTADVAVVYDIAKK